MISSDFHVYNALYFKSVPRVCPNISWYYNLFHISNRGKLGCIMGISKCCLILPHLSNQQVGGMSHSFAVCVYIYINPRTRTHTHTCICMYIYIYTYVLIFNLSLSTSHRSHHSRHSAPPGRSWCVAAIGLCSFWSEWPAAVFRWLGTSSWASNPCGDGKTCFPSILSG